MAVERIIPGTNAWKESHATHAERYYHAAQYVAGLEVLDAACGVGYGSYLLAESGAKSVTGIDVATEAVELAQKHFSHPKIRFQQGDCLALPFPDQSFDMVVSLETIEHLHQPDHFLNELARVLRPGGRLVVSCPNILTNSASPLHKEENPFHHHEMTLAEIRDLVSHKFSITGLYHQSPSLQQLAARHASHLNLCLERSLTVKLENALRKLLGKELLQPLQTIPNIENAINGTAQPVLPIADANGPWVECAHVFMVNATLKS